MAVPVTSMGGAELRRLRTTRLRMSQRVFALTLGVDKGTVSRWERGELPIGRRTAEHIRIVAGSGLTGGGIRVGRPRKPAA